MKLKLFDFMVDVVIYVCSAIYSTYKIVRHANPFYLYCRYIHRGITIDSGYVMAPFGIGGGHTVYYLVCSKCKRVYWEISKSEYTRRRDNG